MKLAHMVSILWVPAVAIILVSPSWAGATSGGFFPDRQLLMSATAFGVTARLERVELCDGTGGCQSGRAFDFAIANRLTGKTSRFTLMNDTAQVDRLVFVSGQRLIILGSASGVLNTVAVVDVAQGAVVDDFNAYCPAFSPTNRYLAFIKFFPRISASPESSAVTLVYDFDLKPSQDRLATAPMGMAGIPVFPAENRHLQTYAPQVQAPDRHLVPGGYVWESASKFHFADDFRSRVTVVTVNLDRGITAPQITFKVKSK